MDQVVEYIHIPKDLEILQIYLQQGQLLNLLNKLSVDDVYELVNTVSFLYELLRLRLSRFIGSKELPTKDLIGFCYYCLSLSRERIYSLIYDPCRELLENRMYYVNVDGNVFEREGYIIYELGDYVGRRWGYNIVNRWNKSFTFEEILILLSGQPSILKDMRSPFNTQYLFSCI